MSSTTIVNTAEAAELRLIHFLGDHDATSPFVTSCESAIVEGDAATLINNICSHKPALDILLANSDGVGAFSLVASFMDKIDDPAQKKQILESLVQAVEQNDSPNRNNKISMLCALYNLRKGTEKCWILGRILSLTSADDETILSLLPERKTTLGSLLEGTNLERLVMGFEREEGSLSQHDIRSLYSTASSVIGKVADVCRQKGMDKEAIAAESAKQRFLLKMLATYSLSDVDDGARTAAEKAAVGAICDPVTLFNEQRCIMSLPPVAAIKETSLYELLEIFQQGKLEDFQSFTTSNPSTLAKYNISSEEAIRHMRLLSLCSLATEHEEIPYGAIASTLQIDQSDVESWVIDAVSSGLLSAKMDQLQHVVMVERCVVRRFGIEQWKILQERLNVWKKNVKSVLDGLKQGQEGTV